MVGTFLGPEALRALGGVDKAFAQLFDRGGGSQGSPCGPETGGRSLDAEIDNGRPAIMDIYGA
eukprot:2426672-Lingulodinium_polyedra.AAC.1